MFTYSQTVPPLVAAVFLKRGLKMKTNEQAKREVAKREVVWESGKAIISVKVPLNASEGTVPGDATIRYLKFIRGVKNGVINFFVHIPTSDKGLTDLYGKQISAKVSVFKKSFADGRSFLYVDLEVVEEKPTHRLSILASVRDKISIQPDEGYEIFETPAPLVGAIVIVPIKSKIRLNVSSEAVRRLARRWSAPLQRTAVH